MKQHITVEQFNEASDDIQYKLYKILRFRHEKDLASNTNIGKMIEILRDKGFDYTEICEQEKIYNEPIQYIGIRRAEIEMLEFFSETICDALWEAVKYILEVEHDNNISSNISNND